MYQLPAKMTVESYFQVYLSKKYIFSPIIFSKSIFRISNEDDNYSTNME